MTRPIPRWRKMTWVFVVVNALFFVWVVASVSDRASEDCAPRDDAASGGAGG